MIYEIWRIDKGVMIEIVAKLNTYLDAWSWIRLQHNYENYVVKITLIKD